MKRYFLILLSSFLLLTQTSWGAKEEIGKPLEVKNPSFLLLIAEQNIEGPQAGWWAAEVDLSIIESRLAQALISQGYRVLEPSQVTDILRKEKAFRRIDLKKSESINLARLSKADYVILGKAIASAGGSVLESNMRSCNASATARLIRVKDRAVIAYLDASSSSVHLDVITGGREALEKAAEDLAKKIIKRISEEK